MKELLWPRTTRAQDLDEVLDILVQELKAVRGQGNERLGYVAGIISSDGPDRIQENLQRLDYYTRRLQSRHDFPLVSATEVFPPELLERLRASGHGKDQFIVFWRKVLGSGHVTDIFMTPRWEYSLGAQDEHKVARALGLRFHYVPEIIFEQDEEEL
ncbi:MAG: hypothetical protein HY397_02360 [Candidatus Doudnabacteria bacterium]|nr:hypothetical protein [Candidatus Doudnabacteria bacterium]